MHIQSEILAVSTQDSIIESEIEIGKKWGRLLYLGTTKCSMCRAGVSGSAFADVGRALDERTIGHNPERLCLMKVPPSHCRTPLAPRHIDHSMAFLFSPLCMRSLLGPPMVTLAPVKGTQKCATL